MKAKHIGLLHEVTDDESAMEAKGLEIKKALLTAGPGSVRASKRLIDLEVSPSEMEKVAGKLCDQRATAECKEGLSAFFERRPPSWTLN